MNKKTNINALILNDTRRDSKHIGCQEVMKNLLHLLKKNGINVVSTIMKVSPDLLNIVKNNMDNFDLLIVNGEGTFHDDKKTAFNLMESLKEAKSNKKFTWLVNTIWENNDLLSAYTKYIDEISVRDSESLHQLTASYDSPSLIPDLSLYIAPTHQAASLTYRQDIIFTDSVDPQVSKILRATAKSNNKPFFKMADGISLKQTIKQPSNLTRLLHSKITPTLNKQNIHSASYVVTGRFHAMLFCVKYGIPFLAIESNTNKILSALKDIKFYSDGVYLEKEDLSTEVLSSKINRENIAWTDEQKRLVHNYTQQAQQEIEHYFHIKCKYFKGKIIPQDSL